jgi:DNA-binding GntR family transcriptional regulator
VIELNSGLGIGAMTSAVLSTILRPTLAQQVAEKIVEAVADGAIRPGERITDSDIAQRLGVSRNPVREAMKMLEAQGIIISSPHRSTHVVAFDRAKVEEIARVRVAIEKIAFGEAAAVYSGNPGLLAELDRIIETMEQCARWKDANGVTKADLAFHRAVCVASKNKIVLTLWETIARHMRISFKLEIQEDTAPLDQIPEHHRALRNALARGDRDEVEHEIEQHIMRLLRSQTRGKPKDSVLVTSH